MEDAHISELNLSIDSAIFGVFDGHGGNSLCFSFFHSQISLKRQGSGEIC